MRRPATEPPAGAWRDDRRPPAGRPDQGAVRDDRDRDARNVALLDRGVDEVVEIVGARCCCDERTDAGEHEAAFHGDPITQKAGG